MDIKIRGLNNLKKKKLKEIEGEKKVKGPYRRSKGKIKGPLGDP